MGIMQNLNKAKVDPDGFLMCTFNPDFLPDQVTGVVEELPPELPLDELQRWRWLDLFWLAQLDYRGTVFYNPLNTSEEHRAKTFDDAPPEGWILLRPGASKVMLDEERIAKERATAIAQVKAYRDARKLGGVQVGEFWFHSDEPSRIQQIGLVMMGANIPAGLQWKTMSGEFVTMTQALALQIFQTAAGTDQAVFAKAEQHRAALEVSSDPAAYNFKTGWPPIYGETP